MGRDVTCKCSIRELFFGTLPSHVLNRLREVFVHVVPLFKGAILGGITLYRQQISMCLIKWLQHRNHSIV